MKKITVETGFGYFIDEDGHIIAKALLAIGEHPCKDKFSYIEVSDKESLNAIEIYQDPAEIEKQRNEIKIRMKMRQIAIDALKAAGELPSDYKDG